MFKVLIVDDEKPIVQGLKVFINWAELGFEVVGEAYNGQTGLELAEKLAPQVIVTDIRMPLVDGLALIEKVKSFNPYCKFIILSGFNDFEYAREAVSKGTFCYLLKPVKENELVNNLLLIKDELEIMDYKKKEENKLKQQLRVSMPVLKERYFNEIITNEIMNHEELIRRWEFLDIKYSLDRFCIFIVEIDDLGDKYKENIEDRLLVKFASNNIINEIIASKNFGVAINYSYDKIIVLCCEDENNKISEQIISNLAKRIQDCIKKYLKETVTISIGGIYSGIRNLSQSFREAESTLKYKLLYGKNSLIGINDIKIFTNNFNLPMDLENKLMIYVETGKKSEAFNALQEIFQYFSSFGYCKPEFYYHICLNILFQISHFMLKCGIAIEDMLVNENYSPRLLFEIKTLDKLKIYMEKAISESLELMDMVRNRKIKGSLWKIKEYIERNYSEELSLDILASKFYINSCYLSQMFKKELGYNFLEILTKVRMDNAKKILLNPELKIYEVASMVGYSNYRYFSHIFKKHSGFTPTAYREKHITYEEYFIMNDA